MGHWHRRGKPTKTDDGITMYPCTEDGCDWAVFVHTNGDEDYTPPRETPYEKTKRLAAERS